MIAGIGIIPKIYSMDQGWKRMKENKTADVAPDAPRLLK